MQNKIISNPKELLQFFHDVWNKKVTCEQCGKIPTGTVVVPTKDPQILNIVLTDCNHKIPIKADAYNSIKDELNFPAPGTPINLINNMMLLNEFFKQLNEFNKISENVNNKLLETDKNARKLIESLINGFNTLGNSIREMYKGNPK